MKENKQSDFKVIKRENKTGIKRLKYSTSAVSAGAGNFHAANVQREKQREADRQTNWKREKEKT